MAVVYAKHEPYGDGHLQDVLADMERRGAPIIRVIRHGQDLVALEGSHRLAAANLLGLRPIFHEVTADVGEDQMMAVFWERAKAGLPVYKFGGAPVFDKFEF